MKNHVRMLPCTLDYAPSKKGVCRCSGSEFSVHFTQTRMGGLPFEPEQPSHRSSSDSSPMV